MKNFNNVKMVKMGTLCDQLRGVSYKKSDAKTIETDGHIPVLRANNINDGLINFDSLVFVPKKIVKDKQIIKEGDVVIAASSGSISVVGKGAQAKENLEASFGAFCKLLRPNSKVNPKFFGHYFQSKSYRHIISNLAAGANINNLKNEHLDDLDFPDIPLPEQKRIAEILDLADEARRKRRENLKLYDDLIRSLFLQTFGDPVSNPMGWDEKRFDALGTLERGKSRHRPRNDPKLLGGKHPLIQTGDVSNADWFIRKYTQTYSDLGLQQSRMWPKGTLCITIAANIADAAILDFDACFPDSVVGFTPGNSINNSYVMCWLFFLKQMIEVKAPAVAQKNINLRILGDLELPVPPMDLQTQFAKQVEEVNEQKAREQALVDQHDDLFNSLLQRAFKGLL